MSALAADTGGLALFDRNDLGGALKQVMAAVARGSGVHLLEAVLRWPPETFIDWKIRSLAARGEEDQGWSIHRFTVVNFDRQPQFLDQALQPRGNLRAQRACVVATRRDGELAAKHEQP